MSAGESRRSLFKAQGDEGPILRLLLLIAFGNGLARTFTRSVAYALFLSTFSAGLLPAAYLVVGITVVTASVAYLRLARRTSLARLLPGTLAAIIGLLLLLRFGIWVSDLAWLMFALVVLYEVSLVMSNLALWNSVGRLFNVQQLKRLSGTISTGEPVAAVVGGFLTAPIVAAIGTENLLLLSAAALAGSLISAALLVRSFGTRLRPSSEQRPSLTQQATPSERPSRYVLLTFALFALVILCYYFVDNLFYAQTQQQFPDAADLAGFIGSFNAVVAIVWTLSNALVIGKVLRRYGLGGVLIVAPATLALSTVAFIFAELAGLVIAVFGMAALNKLFTKLSQDGFVKVALNVMYQPLPTSQRLRVQAQTEGVIYASAIGITGLLLLVLTQIFGFGTLGLAIVLLTALFAWLLVALLLYREYPRQLLRALNKRALGNGVSLQLNDAASRAVLRRALNDPQPGVALYALQMLQQNSTLEAEGLEGRGQQDALYDTTTGSIVLRSAPTSDAATNLSELLPELLRHPAAAVRQEALQVAEQHQLRSVLAPTRAMLPREHDPLVRGTALRLLAALGDASTRSAVAQLLLAPVATPEEAPSSLYALVARPWPEPASVRRGAAVGLLHQEDGSTQRARQVVKQWAAAAEPLERKLAAETIAASRDRELSGELDRLLDDPDLAVRRAAISAVGKFGDTVNWSKLLAALGERTTAKAAANALSSGGDYALPTMAAAFEHVDGRVQERLAQIWGRIGTSSASELLLHYSGCADAAVRTRVLDALLRCRYQPSPEQATQLEDQVQAELRHASWLVGARVASPDPLLDRALSTEIEATAGRVLSLLSLLGDAPTIARARTALSSTSVEQRSYALEIIDTQLAGELKAPVLALLGDDPPERQRERLSPFTPFETPDGWTPALIGAESGRIREWTRSCAIAAAGAQLAAADAEHRDEVIAVIAPLAAAPSPLLAETAQRALAQGPSTGLPGGEQAMLSRIEKVLILKAVEIFAETPDDVLADIAELLHENEVPAGTGIFARGDAGTSMYIIVDGEVRVHDGKHVLNHLYTRDVFGEMALLDPEPRVASVTTMVDTRLLRLDQEPFYELMDERNEVARGVIRVLTQRLRARVRDLSEVRAQLKSQQPESSEPESSFVVGTAGPAASI
jgi:HEAT repeat protein